MFGIKSKIKKKFLPKTLKKNTGLSDLLKKKFTSTSGIQSIQNKFNSTRLNISFGGQGHTDRKFFQSASPQQKLSVTGM